MIIIMIMNININMISIISIYKYNDDYRNSVRIFSSNFFPFCSSSVKSVFFLVQIPHFLTVNVMICFKKLSYQYREVSISCAKVLLLFW